MTYCCLNCPLPDCDEDSPQCKYIDPAILYAREYRKRPYVIAREKVRSAKRRLNPQYVQDQRDRSRRRREADPEKYRALKRKYYHDNNLVEYNRNYRQTNRIHINSLQRTRRKRVGFVRLLLLYCISAEMNPFTVQSIVDFMLLKRNAIRKTSEKKQDNKG